MPLHTTEAVVIGSKDLGEADRIVSFYTRDRGKVRAVAEGARRIRSRFVGSLELFAFGKLVYFERPNKSLHKVNEFGLLEPFRALREALELFVQSAYVVELVDLAVEEGEANEELFSLLLQALRLLAQGVDPALLQRAFEIRLLKLLGYLPELRSCVLCRTPLSGAEPLMLSPSQGGLLCQDCRQEGGDGLLISPPSLAFLKGVLRMEFATLARIGLSPEAKAELVQVLRAWLFYFLGRGLRSADFLSRLLLPLEGGGKG
ncbi:MAG: DNA repair protein RecO [candidate division NC10 bacterium]|nr:DNA repair protein RecO [candidate division NC10 bacterium]